MATVALLSAHHGSDGPAPWGSLRVGGISIIERQMRQAMSAGATRAILNVESESPELLAAIEQAGPGLIVANTGAALADAIGTDDVLLFAEGLVVDDRIVRRMMAFKGAALAVWSGDAPAEAERIDHATCWAGIALIPAEVVTEASLALGEWDMQSTLLRVTAAMAPARLEMGGIDLYAPDRGRDVPLLWLAIRSPIAAQRSLDALLQSTEIGGSTWVSRFIQSPAANMLTRWLSPSRISPVFLTMLTTAAGLIAGVAFATGWLTVGLCLAVGVGVLATVASKLAQVRAEAAKSSQHWAMFDQVIGYAWYLCLGGWVGGSAWLLAAMIILFSWAADLQRNFFNQVTGRLLHDSGAFEQRLSLVVSHRDTLLWLLIPFAWFGLWFAGLAVLAIYATLTFFVTQARVFRRLIGSAAIDSHARQGG